MGRTSTSTSTSIMLMLSLAILASTLPTIGATNLIIRSKNNTWQSWPANIAELSTSVQIDGMVSRSRLALSIKDDYSQTSSFDSLEAVLTFSLPANSVVDSLYLKIGATFEPGYMKKEWAATMIFENIVKRRIDPALLKMNQAGEYTLNIFPFMMKETRSVIICYTTLATPIGNTLSIGMPWNISLASKDPITGVKTTIMIKKCNPLSVALSSLQDETIEKAKTGSDSSSTLVTITKANFRYDNAVLLQWQNEVFTASGMLLQTQQRSQTEKFFVSMVDMKKLLQDSAAPARKVLFVWNLVGVPSGTASNFLYQGSSSLFDQFRLLSAWISSTLRPIDRFGLVINHHHISKFCDTLIACTPSNAAALSRFGTDSISTKTIIGDSLKSPTELIRSAFEIIGTQDSVMVVAIDIMEYNFRENVSPQLVKELVNLYTQKAGSKTSLLWCLNTNYNDKNNNYFQFYQQLASKYTVLSAAYLNRNTGMDKIISEFQPYLGTKIYPVSFTFDNAASRFPYDVLGPENSTIFTHSLCTFWGKLTNDTALTMTIRGVLNGVEFSKSKRIVIDSVSSVGFVDDLWAQEKCRRLSLTVSTNTDRRTIRNICLENRTMSQYTALLALEKWLADSLKMKDDLPSDVDTLKLGKEIINPTNIQPGVENATTRLSVRTVPGTMRITITLPSQVTASADKELSQSLAIIDCRGRAVSDLSGYLTASVRGFTVDASKLSAGVYFIRYRSGKTVTLVPVRFLN
ncbi:MAG: hypothetical protein JW795_23325 [Chitinivibrionales bacterium]|nr:hypothetical protein [Chitinivibrionales bacterium]